MKYVISGVATVILLFFGAVFGLAGITEVEPGEEAVLIMKIGDEDKKGMQYDVRMSEGYHWWNPIKYDIDIYNIQFKQYDIPQMDAQTKDGQPILLDVSFEIGLDPTKVPALHKSVGHNYYDAIVRPLVRKAIRNATSSQLSDQVYQGEGRAAIEASIHTAVTDKLAKRGVIVETINVRKLSFTNKDFVRTLERKAEATQEEIIQKRLALAAIEEAKKMANLADGAKQKRIKAAEALREERRLEGEGERIKLEEEAKGQYAKLKAEADGRKLLVNAYGSAEAVISVEWAKNMGPNVKVYGVPTGAPGTSSYMFDSAMRDMLKASGNMK